jgi:hypothetical protein
MGQSIQKEATYRTQILSKYELANCSRTTPNFFEGLVFGLSWVKQFAAEFANQQLVFDD